MNQLTMELFVCETFSIPYSHYTSLAQSEQDRLLHKCLTSFPEPEPSEEWERIHGKSLRVRLVRNSDDEV